MRSELREASERGFRAASHDFEPTKPKGSRGGGEEARWAGPARGANNAVVVSLLRGETPALQSPGRVLKIRFFTTLRKFIDFPRGKREETGFLLFASRSNDKPIRIKAARIVSPKRGKIRKMALLREDMFPGLDKNAIRRLKAINVKDVFDFAEEDTQKLGRIAKMTYQDVKRFKGRILESFGGRVRSATALLEIEENNVVSTGIECLDVLLNGGLHPGQLYELCGVSSAGKTQMCLSLATNVILKTNGVVRYIDTKSDFSPSRVHMILEAQGHDDEKTARVMNQMRISRVTNVPDLLSVLYDLTRSLEKSTIEEATKLVILDSLPAIILARAENCESFYSLNHLASVCRFIVNEFHISLVVVNLTSQWRDAEGFGGRVVDKPVVVRPTMGKFWLNVPNTRLMIEQLENEERQITVWKSADLRNGMSCRVRFSDTGVN